MLNLTAADRRTQEAERPFMVWSLPLYHSHLPSLWLPKWNVLGPLQEEATTWQPCRESWELGPSPLNPPSLQSLLVLFIGWNPLKVTGRVPCKPEKPKAGSGRASVAQEGESRIPACPVSVTCRTCWRSRWLRLTLPANRIPILKGRLLISATCQELCYAVIL